LEQSFLIELKILNEIRDFISSIINLKSSEKEVNIFYVKKIEFSDVYLKVLTTRRQCINL